MTTNTKIAEMLEEWKRDVDEDEANKQPTATQRAMIRQIEAALARQEAAPISVDRLAQIIRRLDGRHMLGAYEMAEAILDEVSIPAPPAAQAVDLEQFRGAVEAYKAAVNEDCYFDPSDHDENIAYADRLLALIDQQAGGAK